MGRREADRWITAAGLAVAGAAAVVVAGFAAMIWDGDGDHDHDHDHGDEAAVHAHAAAEPDDACPEAWHGVAGGEAVSHSDRLGPSARAALDALAARSIELPCGAVGTGHAGHGRGTGDPMLDGGEPTRTEAEQARLAEQWAAAVELASTLRTEEDVRAAGYRKASGQIGGVGSHWVNWTMVDRPFDPAAPSMVLLHQWPGQDQRLVGFSYWARSVGGPPDGFAGPDDHWHRHLGLCFDDGWLLEDDVPSPDACAGTWLSGHDLWMLHAWVVPGEPNPDGRFSSVNTRLCPGDLAQIPDVLKCSQV